MKLVFESQQVNGNDKRPIKSSRRRGSAGKATLMCGMLRLASKMGCRGAVGVLRYRKRRCHEKWKGWMLVMGGQGWSDGWDSQMDMQTASAARGENPEATSGPESAAG